jgi:hypothetical protein
MALVSLFFVFFYFVCFFQIFTSSVHILTSKQYISIFLSDSDKENNDSASPTFTQYLRLNQNLTKRAHNEMQTSSSDSDDVVASDNRHPRKRGKFAKKPVITVTNPAPIPTTAGTSIAAPSMEDVAIAGSLEREDLRYVLDFFYLIFIQRFFFY